MLPMYSTALFSPFSALCTISTTSATNAIIPMGDLTNHNSKPLPTLRRKFVAFENTGGDTTTAGQLKQRVVEVSWCSFYLIGRIFGLFLVLTGLILIIMVALNDNNPSNSDSTNSIAISDDNTNMHTIQPTVFQRLNLTSPMQPNTTSVNSEVITMISHKKQEFCFFRKMEAKK